ncbi:MAG: nucleotidyl transferase AbiEii/AbiGii toxin family protein [Planctomycetaceae bacterium]|nr:nucleotidyl transferase AbiEii/AbiGii toxin family protein [Planctomycetaceae bacterium]
MKLFEHPDFEQAVLRAAQHFAGEGLRAGIIEKDYFVTEALRIITAVAGDKVIFKGGTSLSKGWNLIQRFSEDIDLFLDPLAFDPALGKKAIDRELKGLRDAVGGHPALTYVAKESQTIGGFGRSDRFSFLQRFGGPGEVVDRVLLEAGTASGREPTTIITLQSYLARFLTEAGVSLGAEDEGAFTCASSISAGRSSRSCLRSTAKSSCSKAKGDRLAATLGTTTTCTDSRSKPKSSPCSNRPSMRPSRRTTIRLAWPASPRATFARKE